MRAISTEHFCLQGSRGPSQSQCTLSFSNNCRAYVLGVRVLACASCMSGAQIRLPCVFGLWFCE